MGKKKCLLKQTNAPFLATVSALIFIFRCHYQTFFSVPETIIPSILIGVSVAIGDTSLFTLLAYLVDLRHTAFFGAVCAIADASFCIAFVIGKFANLSL